MKEKTIFHLHTRIFSLIYRMISHRNVTEEKDPSGSFPHLEHNKIQANSKLLFGAKNFYHI